VAEKTESNLRPEAWGSVDGQPGWLVLMDAPGFKTPRLVLSKQDEYFLRQVAKSLYPNDTLKVIADGAKKYLVRKPADAQ